MAVTVSVCMIVKNEEKTLYNCLAPIKEFVDEIIIVDTGSTDKTIEIAKSLGCRVETFDWCDDFSKPRNYSFSFATKDWIFWMDADDVLSASQLIKPIIETNIQKNPNVDCIILPYIYSKDEFGNPAVTLVRERMLKNNGNWIWERRVHEYLVYPPTAQIIIDDRLTVVHEHAVHAGNRNPRRNLDILEKELAEVGIDKADSRLLAYVGEERRAIQDFQGAINIWQKYLQVTQWNEEKYQILCKMANILRDTGADIQVALTHALNAMLVEPTWGDAYVFLSDYFLRRNELDKSIYFADEALRRGCPQTVLIVNPLDYSFTPRMIKARAYGMKGELEKAIECLNEAIQIRPMPQLIQERDQIQARINGGKLVQSVVELSRYIKPEDIGNYLYALPADIQSAPPIQDVYWKLYAGIDAKKDISKRIDFFVGQGLESWTIKTIDTTGIGGSETQVAYIARGLVKLGWDVRIFGSPEKIEEIDGVMYTNAKYFNPKEERKALISSRIPEVMKDVENCQNRILVCHDINMQDRLSDIGYAENIDKLVFVSKYCKQIYQSLYPWITDEKSVVFPNGIDINKIHAAIDANTASGIKKDRFRMIWSSSPDRGLDTLLQMFPRIRQRFPKASLHIAYGFGNIDKVIASGQAPQLAQLKDNIMRLAQQPRCFIRGRLAQPVLYREMLKASVWMYPTMFLESNCITATEALSCGCYPITANIGALPETIGSLGTLIEGSPLYEEVQEKFIEEYCRLQEITDENWKAYHLNCLEKMTLRDWDSRINEWNEWIK